MKKLTLLSICSICIALVILAGSASADETFVCTFGQKERVISVVYEDQGSKLPCEVRYHEDGGTRTMWVSEHNEGFCEQKAADFVKQQVAWGWRCGASAPEASPAKTSPELSEAEKAYMQQALVAQSLATMSSFKMFVIEFYLMEGRSTSLSACMTMSSIRYAASRGGAACEAGRRDEGVEG